MAQAIGDREELERCVHSLQQCVDSLNDAVGNLNGAFASLGDTWQDEKRARFEEDYNALVQQRLQFNSKAEEQVPYPASLATWRSHHAGHPARPDEPFRRTTGFASGLRESKSRIVMCLSTV